MLKKHYDFILCDLNMPVMDGFECASKIISHYSSQELFNHKEKEDCPLLIACSAMINAQVEKKASESGFDMCIQSPLTMDIIKQKILPALQQRSEKFKQSKPKKVGYLENSEDIDLS